MVSTSLTKELGISQLQLLTGSFEAKSLEKSRRRKIHVPNMSYLCLVYAFSSEIFVHDLLRDSLIVDLRFFIYEKRIILS